MQDEILKLTKELIKIPSVSTNTLECEKALNVANTYLGTPKTLKFKNNGHVSLLFGNTEKLLNPDILLLGHLDVVDAKKSLFNPIIKGDKLIGRGAGDMKGHVAAMLYCFKIILSQHSDKSICLLLTTDEEIGGFNGAKYVISKGLSPNVVIIPDGAYNFNLVESEKAPHHFVVQSESAGGHASRSFEINNPINNIVEFYEEVRTKYSKASKDNTWKTTFEMTTFETDNLSKNKIPGKVTASFSWRWPLEHIKFNIGRKEIMKMALKHQCIVIEEEGGGEGTLINKDEKYIKLWKNLVEETLKIKVRFVKSHGSSDARHFFNSKMYGSKNIIITSAITGGHHGDDEWVNIKSLNKLAVIILKYIRL